MGNEAAIIIGNKIKELRAINKISQAQLAEKLGLSDSIISGYERGARLPSLEVFREMANIFNVSLDSFFDDGDIDARLMVDLSDLTDDQFYIVTKMIKEFMDYNKLKENKKD